jgi:hypothetical protein
MAQALAVGGLSANGPWLSAGLISQLQQAEPKRLILQGKHAAIFGVRRFQKAGKYPGNRVSNGHVQSGKAFWQQSKRNPERPVDLGRSFGQVSGHQITGEAYVRY